MGVNIEKPEVNSVESSEADRSGVAENSSLGQIVQYNKCYNCQDKINSRKRVFSKESWEALLLWDEISPSTVQMPICDYCYHELRSILMERNDELESPL